MAEGKNTTLVWAAIGVAVLFLVGGLSGLTDLLKGGQPAVAPSTTTTISVPSTICESSTTPDLTISAYDIDNPNTALTETVNSRRKVGDTTWTVFTQGTAITNLEVGKQYEILMGVNTSNSSGSAYGPYFVTDPIPCAETSTLTKQLYQDDLQASNAITAKFYDNNHDAATIEAFGAGDVKDVYLSFQAVSDLYIGNPYIKDSTLPDNAGVSGAWKKDLPNILCLKLKTAEWDKTNLEVHVGATKLPTVGQPVIDNARSNTTLTSYCFAAPVIPDFKTEFVVHLDADDVVNPAGNASADLYAGNFYINKEGLVAWGVEDHNGKAIGDNFSVNMLLG